jgi:hypothetical protein
VAPTGTLYERGGPPYLVFAAMLASAGIAPPLAPAIVGNDGRVRRIRRSRLTSEVVARVMAVHLLSRDGGGRRTQKQAHDMVTAVTADLALLEPVGWERELRRVRRMLARDFAWDPFGRRQPGAANQASRRLALTALLQEEPAG